MLILVAVTVNTAINSGLFGHAKNAVSKWGDAERQEQTDLNTVSSTIDAITNPEVDFPPTSPIYARLYTDGTFILSGTDYKDTSRTLSKDYGDISAKKYYWNEEHSGLPEWSAEPIKNVLVYDKIQPVNTSCWFFRSLVDKNNELQDTIETMDLRNLDTSKVKNMMDMFSFCNKLTELDVSGFDTSNVWNMQSMFSRCKNLTKLDLSNFDTSSVTTMTGMFLDSNNLTEINLSNFDTSNVTDMHSMFGNCYALEALNVSNFNTSKVTHMGAMFAECNNLTNIDVSNFDTVNVNNMSWMFHGCDNLATLDVSNFNTGNVTTMQKMFSACIALKSLNLSSFNTSNVTNMSSMFQWSYNITELDLSNFTVNDDTNLEDMLTDCTSLQTIYVKDEATKAKLQALKSDCTITIK